MITTPKIHDNGSGGSRLIEHYVDAFGALGTAYAKIKATAPNPRDYPRGFEAASDEHMARLARVDEVQREITAIIAEIQAQTEATREYGKPDLNGPAYAGGADTI